MPRPKIDKTAIIEARKGEIVNDADEAVDAKGIPTPEAQDAILNVEPETYVIKLLDDTEAAFSKLLTIEDLFKKRIDGKVMAVWALIKAEEPAFAKIPEIGERLSLILASSEPVYHAVISLLAKLTGQPEIMFLDNIKTGEIVRAFFVVTGMLSSLTGAAKNHEAPTKK